MASKTPFRGSGLIALDLALVRIIKDSRKTVYPADLHQMIEERTGFDVPMHQFMHRLRKLAHQDAIRSQREAEPPYRQRFMPADTGEELIEASLPLSDVEHLRVIREIELSLQPDPKPAPMDKLCEPFRPIPTVDDPCEKGMRVIRPHVQLPIRAAAGFPVRANTK